MFQSVSNLMAIDLAIFNPRFAVAAFDAPAVQIFAVKK
jgi:hypothetical protein